MADPETGDITSKVNVASTPMSDPEQKPSCDKGPAPIPRVPPESSSLLPTIVPGLAQPAAVIYGDPSKKCRCTIGWMLFGIGWIPMLPVLWWQPVPWFAGSFVYCWTKNVHDRRAAIANGIMSVLWIGASIAYTIIFARLREILSAGAQGGASTP